MIDVPYESIKFASVAGIVIYSRSSSMTNVPWHKLHAANERICTDMPDSKVASYADFLLRIYHIRIPGRHTPDSPASQSTYIAEVSIWSTYRMFPDGAINSQRHSAE